MIVDQPEKKGRRRKTPSAGPTRTQTPGATARQGLQPAADEGLSPNLQAHIGRQLRAVFDEVAREPIPDRLLRLLKELERSGDK